ncbi:hypothetical protein ACG3SL_11075 [Sphingomonas sp. CJ20]
MLDLTAETPEHILRVGQDAQGHWIVQEADGCGEALFASRTAAIRFAHWECHAFDHARVELCASPLSSILTRPGAAPEKDKRS